jgi:hypothetical protein
VILYINPVILTAGPPDAFRWLMDALGNPQVVHLPCEIDEAGDWLAIDNKADYPESILGSGRFFQVSSDRGLTKGARAFATSREIAQRYGKVLEQQPAPPVLFLDVDGVLHGLNGAPFSKREALWQILRAAPMLNVVFTSSWRERHSLAELAGLATAGGGEDLMPRFIGMTPIIKETRKAHRQAEIMDWLESHGTRQWIALDDDPGLFEKHCPNLIRCPVSGLDQATVGATLRRLRPTIFLDLDGVLHPEGGDTSRLFECAPRLWAILRTVPEAQVVFSTSWRLHHSLDELIDFASACGGEDLAERFVGITPLVKSVDEDRGDYRRRELECLAWREHTGHVGNWLAIDDIEHWFSPLTRNVFISDFRTGLSDADVPVIIDRLLGV